jgi:transposase
MDAETEADRFVGIDVSKARVDVHVRPEGSVFYCTTDTDGLAELVGRLTPLRPRLVVLEASGGYEGVVAAALAEAGLPVAIVNPPQVRKFAGAIGRLAKTDAIDAGVIAHFTFESGCGRDTDSLLEQMRFEPSVPLSAGWLVEI